MTIRRTCVKQDIKKSTVCKFSKATYAAQRDGLKSSAEKKKSKLWAYKELFSWLHVHRTFLNTPFLSLFFTSFSEHKHHKALQHTYSSTPVESLWSLACHCTGRNSTLPIARFLDSSSWWSNNIWRLTFRKSLTENMKIKQ